MKRISISQKMFSSFCIIIFIFAILQAIGFSLLVMNIIKEDVIDVQKDITQVVAESVEKYFVDMNDFSLAVTGDREFREWLISDLLNEELNTNEVMRNVYVRSHQGKPSDYYISAIVKEEHYLFAREYLLFEPMKKIPDFYENDDKMGLPVVKLQAGDQYLKAIDKKIDSATINEEAIVLARGINVASLFKEPQAIFEVKVSKKDFDTFIGLHAMGVL